MAEDVYPSHVIPSDLHDIEVDNQKCLNENRALRSKLQLVKENSSLRVVNILAEVLTWIDGITRNTPTSGEGWQNDSQNTYSFESTPRHGERSGNLSTHGQIETESVQLLIDKTTNSPLPETNLIHFSPDKSSFQPSRSFQTLTPPDKLYINENLSGLSPPYSDNHTTVTSDSNSPRNDKKTTEEDMSSMIIKPTIRERRGSIIYDTGDIKLSVQQSQGFKPIEKVSDMPEPAKERSQTPEITDHSHGYVWRKSETPPLFALSTPINDIQPNSTSANTDKKWRSAIPVKESRQKSWSPRNTSTKTENSLIRSPRSSPINTDEVTRMNKSVIRSPRSSPTNTDEVTRMNKSARKSPRSSPINTDEVTRMNKSVSRSPRSSTTNTDEVTRMNKSARKSPRSSPINTDEVTKMNKSVSRSPRSSPTNTDELRMKKLARRSPRSSPINMDYQTTTNKSASRSPRSSPVNTDELMKRSPREYDKNFSSNASSVTYKRGRSVTPSSRKNRSPYGSLNEAFTIEAETSGFYSQDADVSINGMKVTPATKLLGEIAFQLDRKILNYVFRANKNKRRFYGYLITNIPEKIRRETTIDEIGLVDVEKKIILDYRYKYIIQTLTPLGYKIDFHPDFCADMVNKYGLLPLPPDRSPSSCITADEKELVLETVKRIAASQEEIDQMTIVLNCLALLAKDSDTPLICF